MWCSGNWSENRTATVDNVAYSLVQSHGVNTLVEGNYAFSNGTDPGIGIELSGTGEITGNYVEGFWWGAIVYTPGFNVHDNAFVNDGIAVVNQNDSPGIIANNVTDPTAFAMPQKPGTAAPPVLTPILQTDTGGSSTDKITSIATLAGTADPNAVNHFSVDGQPVTATARADASGAWSFSPTGLADGQHTVVASETN